MLRAYNDKTKVTATRDRTGYIDSVTDYARFVSQEFDEAGYTHDDLYQRERTDGEDNLFGLGGMDFTISEAQIDGNKARPVVDIRASREKDYITSRLPVVLRFMIMTSAATVIIPMIRRWMRLRLILTVLQTVLEEATRLCTSTKGILGS